MRKICGCEGLLSASDLSSIPLIAHVSDFVATRPLHKMFSSCDQLFVQMDRLDNHTDSI